MPFSPTKLRTLREARGLTPNTLALEMYKAADVSVSGESIRRWEAGYCDLRYSMIEALAIALDCEMSDLLE